LVRENRNSLYIMKADKKNEILSKKIQGIKSKYSNHIFIIKSKELVPPETT